MGVVSIAVQLFGSIIVSFLALLERIVVVICLITTELCWRLGDRGLMWMSTLKPMRMTGCDGMKIHNDMMVAREQA